MDGVVPSQEHLEVRAFLCVRVCAPLQILGCRFRTNTPATIQKTIYMDSIFSV